MPNQGGAPLGNKNAYRHGLYSRQFKTAERRALHGSTLNDLSAEIELVRVYLRRFVESQGALSTPLEFDDQLAFLKSLDRRAVLERE